MVMLENICILKNVNQIQQRNVTNIECVNFLRISLLSLSFASLVLAFVRTKAIYLPNKL